jgi:hypothetical protein
VHIIAIITSWFFECATPYSDNCKDQLSSEYFYPGRSYSKASRNIPVAHQRCNLLTTHSAAQLLNMSTDLPSSSSTDQSPPNYRFADVRHPPLSPKPPRKLTSPTDRYKPHRPRLQRQIPLQIPAPRRPSRCGSPCAGSGLHQDDGHCV